MIKTDARAVRSRAKLMACDCVEEAEAQVIKLLHSARGTEEEIREIRSVLSEFNRSSRIYTDGLTRSRPLGMGAPGNGRHADHTYHAARRSVEWYGSQCRRLEARSIQLLMELELIDDLMADLNKTQRNIIKTRWIEDKTWIQVAGKVYLSERQSQRVGKAAIGCMAKRYLSHAKE